MKIKSTLTFVILHLVLCVTTHAQLSFNNDHVPGQLITQLKKGVSIQKFVDSYHPQYGLKVESNLSEPLAIWLLSFNATAINENEMLAKINAHHDVKAVQFNHYVEERILEPNDPEYLSGAMWDMKNTGQNGGTIDADIDAPEAWELCTGGITADGDTVVVAVVDGGFFLNHEDLNFWKNYNEIPGNNIDDDNNGYVDDAKGWNAYNNNGTMTSSQHGTHVSGTVAARGNNDIGVVGVNWNAQVMPIQASSGTESIVVIGYGYAFKQRQLYNQTAGAQGAFVVATNSSFGVNNGNPVNFPIWCGMYDSLGSVGILSAGATANANYNIDVTLDMPTACPNEHLITVTNTTRNDVRNTGAAYGLTTIDLGSPGTTIESTTPNNQYAALTGTSMATPHVAGAVALMISAACPQLLQDYKNYPDSIALLFKQFMLDNVDSLADLLNETVTGGRLNIHKSLVAINSYCTLTTNEAKNIGQYLISDLEIQPNPVSNYLQLAYKMPVSSTVSFAILDITGRVIKNEVRANFSEGYHNHILNVEELNSGVYFLQLNMGNSKSIVKKFIKN